MVYFHTWFRVMDSRKNQITKFIFLLLDSLSGSVMKHKFR